MFGQYHIVLEENENTAYPVEEDSIRPCLEGKGLVEKPWNRWYVNEKMLPRLQDTVLICKGGTIKKNILMNTKHCVTIGRPLQRYQ